jgi:hypothetical protein
MSNRRCGFCGALLRYLKGNEESASERAGNARYADEFACSGCAREFRHSVSERFSGDIEWWGVRERGASEFETLAEEHWPRF